MFVIKPWSVTKITGSILFIKIENIMLIEKSTQNKLTEHQTN